MIKSKFKSFDDKEVSYLFFESKRSKIKKNILIILKKNLDYMLNILATL